MQVEKIIEEDDLYAYALERLHQAMLKGENLESVASQFQDVFVEGIYAEVKPLRILFPRWARYMAAAVVLIGFVSILFFSRQRASFSDPALNPYETRLGLKGSESQDIISTLILAYQNQNYQNVIALGEQILEDSIDLSASQFNEVQLCLGYSYLVEELYDQAINAFEKVLEVSDARARTEARWYLALVYIKKNDIDEARRYLKTIQPPDAGKSRIEDAEVLLEKLPLK